MKLTLILCLGILATQTAHAVPGMPRDFQCYAYDDFGRPFIGSSVKSFQLACSSALNWCRTDSHRPISCRVHR